MIFKGNILQYKDKVFNFDEKIINVAEKNKLVVVLETKFYVHDTMGSYYNIFDSENSLEKIKVQMNYDIFIEINSKIYIIRNFIRGKEYLVDGELITTCERYILFRKDDFYFILDYKNNKVYALTIDLNGYKIEGYKNNLLIIDTNKVVVVDIKNSMSVREIGCIDCVKSYKNGFGCKNSNCVKNTNIQTNNGNRNLFVKIENTEIKRFGVGDEFIAIGNALFLDNIVITQNYSEHVLPWFVKYLNKNTLIKYLGSFYTSIDEVELCKSIEKELALIFEKEFLETKDKMKFITQNSVLIEGMANNCKSEIFKSLINLKKFQEYDRRIIENIKIDENEYNAICLSDFNYNRLFFFKEQFNDIDNIAYKYLRSKEFFLLKRDIDKYIGKALKHYYKDSRITDMYNFLDLDKIGSIAQDVVDPKQARENAFVYRRMGIMGIGYFYFGCKKTKEVKYHGVRLKRRNLIEVLEPQKSWNNIGTVHYNIVNFLGNPLDQNVSFEYFKDKMNEPEPFCGMAYALGLQGKLKDIEFTDLINSSCEFSIGLILGIAISNRGSNDEAIISQLIELFICDTPFSIKPISALALGFLSLGNPTSFSKSIILEQLKKKGRYPSEEHNKGNILWYDEIYRIVTVLGLSLLYITDEYSSKNNFMPNKCYRKEVFNLEDSLCELLLNGIIFFNSQDKKILPKLKRSSDSKPEEIYYSALLYNCVTFEKDIYSVIDYLTNIEDQSSLYYKYRASGELMYAAIYYLRNKNECRNNRCQKEKCVLADKRIKKRLLDIALRKEYRDKFMFINILLCLAIMFNGTSDIELLKITRRKILEYEDIDHLQKRKEFAAGKYENTFLYYPDVIRYHQILGLLSPGAGFYELEFNHILIFNIISSFYIIHPVTAIDQGYFQLLRYFIVLNFKSSKYLKHLKKVKLFSCINECKYKLNKKKSHPKNHTPNNDNNYIDTIPTINPLNTPSLKNKQSLIINGYNVVRDIKIKYNNLHDILPECGIERKIIIDILSDYYEQTKDKKYKEIAAMLRYYM